jgi:hypothetical protein
VGKPITCFNTIGMCESKDFIEAADGGEIPKVEHSVVLKVSKILVSLGASVSLTLATGREPRVIAPQATGARADPIRRTLAATSVGHSGLSIAKVANQMPGAWQCTRVLASPLSPSSNDRLRYAPNLPFARPAGIGSIGW